MKRNKLDLLYFVATIGIFIISTFLIVNAAIKELTSDDAIIYNVNYQIKICNDGNWQTIMCSEFLDDYNKKLNTKYKDIKDKFIPIKYH